MPFKRYASKGAEEAGALVTSWNVKWQNIRCLKIRGFEPVLELWKTYYGAPPKIYKGSPEGPIQNSSDLIKNFECHFLGVGPLNSPKSRLLGVHEANGRGGSLWVPRNSDTGSNPRLTYQGVKSRT